MATKTFLSHAEIEHSRGHFAAAGDLAESEGSSALTLGPVYSRWLSDRLLEKLSAVPGWLEAKPVALGSWARDELCPKSDIDLIFFGPEDVVQKVVGEIQARGLRLRARVPEDLKDWTVGVEPFDVLAILHGRTFSAEAEAALNEQREAIMRRGEAFALQLRQAILREKEVRNARHDSVANYLEPNIKYGAGGMRDLQQALDIMQLFSDRFIGCEDVEKLFVRYKMFFLSLRQRLHLIGGSEILVGAEQADLAKFFGFKSVQDFMREFQTGISLVNFYANWVLYVPGVSKAKLKAASAFVPQEASQALKRLEKDSSLLTQAQILRRLPRSSADGDLARHFHIDQREEFFVALFDSRLIDRLLPDVAKVRGLVQHDHYHRFTVDAHLLQAIRELKRTKRSAARLGRLKSWVKSLNAQDWQILLWTCLFHDLGKGRGGDHSRQGAALAQRDLKSLGVATSISEEVAWLVQHHLVLSTAAFRMDIRSPTTWRLLQTQGVMGQRLVRLALFTAIDIRATNPDAWTDWKERLLADLIVAMQSPEATEFLHLLDKAEGQGAKITEDLVKDLDPQLAQSVPHRVLLDDFRSLRRSKKDLVPRALRNRKGEVWIRFHQREDQTGLFLQYVSKLYAIGCSIQQSSVRTLPDYGVYDWFQVKTKKPAAQILKQLDLIKAWSEVTAPAVHFQHIDLVSNVDGESIISFRGRDQKGLLLAAAHGLFASGLTIRWARVHTWGAQIDDVFGVQTPSNIEQVLVDLRSRFHVSEEKHEPSVES